jgi:hypothetical protein
MLNTRAVSETKTFLQEICALEEVQGKMPILPSKEGGDGTLHFVAGHGA